MEKSPENKERPNKSELPPRKLVSEDTKRAIGRTALGGKPKK